MAKDIAEGGVGGHPYHEDPTFKNKYLTPTPSRKKRLPPYEIKKVTPIKKFRDILLWSMSFLKRMVLFL